MQAYSLDLRQRVVAAVEAGMTWDQAAATFNVSRSTVARYRRHYQQTGHLAPRPRPGRPSRTGAALIAGLETQLQDRSDATIAAYCAAWQAATDEAVSPSTMRRAIQALGWTRKKSP